MAPSNDVRGWVLTSISALACILGASVIYIDTLVRLLPTFRSFRIQDNNAFLSSSLSLSAGVMLFSSLYKLLPESHSSLTQGGFTNRAAAWILIACFLAGVWGIQVISRTLHMLLPSQVVDCDHTHDEDVERNSKSRAQSHSHANGYSEGRETTPLIHRPSESNNHSTRRESGPEMRDLRAPTPLEMGHWDRPSLQSRLTRKMTAFVSGEKEHCDHDGPCKGFSNPCSPECFRNINARGGMRAPTRLARSTSTRPSLTPSATTTFAVHAAMTNGPGVDDHSIDTKDSRPNADLRYDSHQFEPSPSSTQSTQRSPTRTGSRDSSHAARNDDAHGDVHSHHHHVPQNAFLSLSFQTSVAIVLHKLPEGFITFASNHANPDLGFNVFMALAIHNITEGFCLALPIYLATSSRLRALLYSFVLGGFSQPIGAGIAAVWLAVAERGKGDYAPSQGVYGGLFAATAGILANVALNLLSQSFELSHNKGLVMFFVFVGMGILGISSALTA